MKPARSTRLIHSILALLTAVAWLVALTGCQPAPEAPTRPVEEKVEWPEIAGYAKMVVPTDNRMTPAKVALGKQLFYDQRLSGDGSRACYSCHLKEHGLAEGVSTRLLIYAGRLIQEGISARRSCQVAVVWALTDDHGVQRSIEEVVSSIFE